MAASIYSTVPVVESTILWFIFRFLFYDGLEIELYYSTKRQNNQCTMGI